MLSKLIKYELKATARYLIPLYITLVIISIINRITIHFDNYQEVFHFIQVFIIFTHVALIFLLGAVTFLLMVSRFYKNLLSDEGYLMFTLPVKIHQLIASKLIISTFWFIISLFAILGSLYYVFVTPDTKDLFLSILNAALDEMKNDLGVNTNFILIPLFFTMITSIVANLLMIFTSISIGHLFKGHKLIGFFIAYIALNTSIQFIMMIIILIGGLIFSKNPDQIRELGHYVFLFISTIQIILSTIFFLSINYILKNKLNLE